MHSVLQDMRYSLRMMLKKRGVTAIALITLALGIGANSAIFTVVNSVLLRPLAYRDSDRLVMIWGNFSKLNIERLPAKAAEYEDYRAQNQIFDQVAAFDNQNFNLTLADQAERIVGARVTPVLFSMLGAQVEWGRRIATDEAEAGHNLVVVLSYGFWQRHFGGETTVVGQRLKLNDQDYTIIGVMPADFQFPPTSLPFAQPAEVWIPLVHSSEQVTGRQGPYYLNVLAHLKPGVTLAQAQAQMTALGQSFEEQYRGYRGPNGEDGGWRIAVAPLREEAVGNSRTALLILFGAVGLVLLIACANVANLMLVRATAQQKEVAIRAALGANRWRIARQYLIESLLLALLGGGLGLLLAQWGIDLLIKLGPAGLPRVAEIKIDGRVVLFTTGLAILTGVLCSLIPALRASRLDLQSTLKESRALGGWRWQYGRNLLVVSEVALSLMLLIGAGLLAKTFVRLQRVNPGVAAEEVLTAQINLPELRYRDPAQVSGFYRELIERLEALPGVQGASVSTMRPLNGQARSDPFAIEGRPFDPNNLTSAGWQIVGANYFGTLDIPMLQGRDLTARDTDEKAPTVAIINETMARRFWPTENPMGRRITLGLPRPDNPWITIVGIAKDLPHRAIDSPAEPDWYLSRAPGPQRNRYLFVRTVGDPTNLAALIRSQVFAIDRQQPVTNVKSMRDVIAETVAPRKFNMLLFGLFAAIAVALAAMGIYGVISYSVAERTQEIGVRVALGARRVDVMKLVLRGGLSLALMGVAIGLAGAFVLTRLMKSLLFGVTPTDAVTFASVSLGVIAVALFACYIPARRATKVDPLVALRYE
jgi:putative ABC transport system permease protein